MKNKQIKLNFNSFPIYPTKPSYINYNEFAPHQAIVLRHFRVDFADGNALRTRQIHLVYIQAAAAAKASTTRQVSGAQNRRSSAAE